MHGTGHLGRKALEVQIIKLPSESQIWARGKLQRKNLGVSPLYSPWILSYYKIKNPSPKDADFYFEIKRAHSLKVRPCLEYYSLALKNAINRTVENTLKDYPLVGPPGFEPGTYRL